jgi:hypothetical protein
MTVDVKEAAQRAAEKIGKWLLSLTPVAANRRN